MLVNVAGNQPRISRARAQTISIRQCNVQQNPSVRLASHLSHLSIAAATQGQAKYLPEMSCRIPQRGANTCHPAIKQLLYVTLPPCNVKNPLQHCLQRRCCRRAIGGCCFMHLLVRADCSGEIDISKTKMLVMKVCQLSHS